MKTFVAHCGVREVLVAAPDEAEAARAIEAAGGPRWTDLVEAGALATAKDPEAAAQAVASPGRLLARPLWSRRLRYDVVTSLRPEGESGGSSDQT